jgi:hypothetical protein
MSKTGGGRGPVEAIECRTKLELTASSGFS